jgi:hypothetical protein
MHRPSLLPYPNSFAHQEIFAGEMTFWPITGIYKGKGQKKIGSKYLDFDRSTYKPFVLSQLEKRQSRFNLYPLT